MLKYTFHLAFRDKLPTQTVLYLVDNLSHNSRKLRRCWGSRLLLCKQAGIGEDNPLHAKLHDLLGRNSNRWGLEGRLFGVERSVAS